jgi:hypothetical protein
MLKKLLFVLILFSTQKALAQTPEELLEKTRLNYTPEKIYLHFDKQSYIAGDTIWFKAYLMNGFVPSTKSTVLNVELLSDSGKIIARKIIPVSASMAANAIELPTNLKQGAYTITAFTSLMMNFGTANFYNKQINIYNPNNIQAEKDVPFLPELKFFPEAGNLVVGHQNTIAFKCTDNNGYPLSVEGKIINTEGKELLQFKSTHDGMGKFQLLPSAGIKYYAECIIDGNIKKTVALQESIYNISLMNVTNNNGKAILEINSSNVTDDLTKASYVLGVEENMVAFKIVLKEDDLITRAELPTTTLPSGVLKVTMFNKTNQPLAERLIFVNSGDYEVKTNLILNNLNTAARKKNELIFEIEDTTQGSYSVAITNAEFGIESVDGKDNIISRFLLTDNFKGKINNPAYYFEKNDEVHAQNLDLVMLTNGWRRYTWTEIMRNKFPEMNFKDPNYITIRGIAYEPFDKSVLKDAALMLFARTKDSANDFVNIKTDKNGNFELARMLFEDTASFFIQKSEGKDKRVNLKLLSPSLATSLSITKQNIPYFNFTKPTANQAEQIAKMLGQKNENIKNAQILESVRVIGKVKTKAQQYEDKYVSGSLGKNAARTLDFLAEPPYSGINIFDYLRNKLVGVNISGGPSDYQLNYRNTRSLIGGPIQMALYLDDFPIDPSQVAWMPASQFALVKLYAGGPLVGPGGAIALYSNKDPNFIGNKYTDFRKVVIDGFSITKEFYAPDYSVPSVYDNIRDSRTTLYWNPYLTADKKTRQIKVAFFNSDSTKKFRVVIEGFTRDGGLVHLEKIVE